MSRIAAFVVLAGTATLSLAQRLPVPESAPTLSDWGVIGLGVIVAVAAGLSLRGRHRK